MRFSVEKEIVRYPVGEETNHAPERVSNVGFLQYNLGGGIFVWRSPDGVAEIGQRGGSYYVRINGVLVVASYSTLRGAMQAAAIMLPPHPDQYVGHLPYHADPTAITARN
jgi:hypothetical protein